MEMWLKGLHNICNMGTHGLPDMYTPQPERAPGPKVHISGRPLMSILQITKCVTQVALFYVRTYIHTYTKYLFI